MTITTPEAPLEHEFGRGWPLLAASVLGSALIGVPLYATGVLIAVWEVEFGWQRSAIGIALSLFNAALVIAVPMIGRLASRIGVRRPALWSLALLAPAFLLISYAGPEIWTLQLGYFLFALVGAGATFVTFTRSVNEYFVRHRGLAIGIVCSSTTLCMIATPLLTNWVLASGSSWRTVWVAFAVITAMIWPVVYFGLREVPVGRTGETTTATTSSMITDRGFLLLGTIFFLISFAATSIMLQIVPLSLSLGLTRDAALTCATLLAVGVGVSRLIAGLALDRIFAPHLLRGIVFAGIAGCLLVAFGPGATIYLGALLIGAAVGAEGDLLAYLTARYFAVDSYARIYGQLYSIMLCGVIASPFAAGLTYDLSGGYRPIILAAAVLFTVAALLIGRLPAYRG